MIARWTLPLPLPLMHTLPSGRQSQENLLPMARLDHGLLTDEEINTGSKGGGSHVGVGC